jgi:hypothetical protein
MIATATKVALENIKIKAYAGTNCDPACQVAVGTAVAAIGRLVHRFGSLELNIPEQCIEVARKNRDQVSESSEAILECVTRRRCC